jgi:tryptophanyl-tRNA synthetase
MYEEDPQLVKNIIADGCEKARKLAQDTMRDVREAIGLDYS